MKIAILEDMKEQANRINSLLTAHNYETTLFSNGQDLISSLKEEDFDLLLLDWEVPIISGIEVLKWVRENLNSTLPIIMLTQRDNEEDIVHALNLGANDYLQKPVGERELLARLAVQLRKQTHQTKEKKEITQIKEGKFTLNIESRSVNVDGKNINLPEREFELILLLFKNPGRILTKDFFIQNIWGNIDRKYDATLSTYISNLRKTLELRPKNRMVISTVYNYGYRLERF